MSTSTQPIIIHCDGACLPTNPGGTATWAYVAYRGETAVARDWGVVLEGEGATNNVAEYAAIFHALEWVTKMASEEQVVICSDSQLAINQLNGVWFINKTTLRQWKGRCDALQIKLFGKISYRWIPREENDDADALTKYAYQEHVQRQNKQVITPQPQKETTMNLSEMYPSKYIKATDLTQPRTLQIQTVQMELIGQQKDNKPVLYFAGEPKGLVMNKTIAAQVAYITRSEDTDRWRGCWVELHRDMTTFQGKPIDCVRVRAPQAPAQQPPPNGGQQAQPQGQPQYQVPQGQQPQYAPPQGQPVMAPPNAVYDEPNTIPDPGDPLRAGDRRQPF